ncbi:hypothetical protein [Leptolyngbya sp. FACHB-261]|uniref:hypothetical protein n=1 Tax=Leptolyngbya sp. FACHB-261 TaxID=2692806 RepID=UPI0016891D31|nr:hypothetical protein [Leptolyngbya sp. FACHB-261]MBD2104083.1 hypothetical protein [Leptolyngbya sp. FACHB-261]
MTQQTDAQAPEQSQEQIFDAALEQYKSGTPAKDLIPTFKALCDHDASNSAAWTCLAWLYLLDDKAEPAYKAAVRSVKLNRTAVQSRVNLALAMLETSRKGVREHVEVAQQAVRMVPELAEEVIENLEEGLRRRPNWKAALRIKSWLFDKES